MLPAGSPMKCTAPADVYMLLKSSDYVLHDLDREIEEASATLGASS